MTNENYGKGWHRVVVMVSDAGEVHSIGGDALPSNGGESVYPGFDILKSRLAASQPGENNPLTCPKCRRKADGYISATPTRKGGHYKLLCDYSPSHPSESAGPETPRREPSTPAEWRRQESCSECDGDGCAMCEPDPPAEPSAEAKGPTIDEQIANLQNKRDEDIDTSDIPEVKDWSGVVVGKFYRNPAEPAVVSEDLVDQLMYAARNKNESAVSDECLRLRFTSIVHNLRLVAADLPKVEEVARGIAKIALPTWNHLSNPLQVAQAQENNAQIIADFLRPYFPVSQTPTSVIEAATQLLDAMESCHICKAQVLLEETPVHCEDCSADCEGHDEPECQTIKALHANLRRIIKQLAVAPVSGNGPEPLDAETEFRIWMAKHSTTDYIGGELRHRAAVEFAEYYAVLLAGAASHNGQGWVRVNAIEFERKYRDRSKFHEAESYREASTGSIAMSQLYNGISSAYSVVADEWLKLLAAPPSEANVPTEEK